MIEIENGKIYGIIRYRQIGIWRRKHKLKLEEYGKENNSIIVMLHGANFVHCYGRQYSLANSFHIIVPHIMGFGDEAGRIFYTDTCCAELVNMIRSLNKKVLLVGFSLGAQLAFKLVSE